MLLGDGSYCRLRTQPMTAIIAIVNQKGGTGKTTTAANLAFACVAEGRRVLAVDIDPQASLTFYFGHDERRLEAEERTLYWALLGHRSLDEIILQGPPALVPASIALAKADAELLSEPGATWVLKEALGTSMQLTTSSSSTARRP